MVLSPEEVTLLHGMVQTATNVTTYGYEVAVKGTVVDGIACLVCGIITILACIYVAKKSCKWAKEEEERTRDGFAYFMAFLAVVVVLIVVGAMCSIAIHDPFMKIFAPEYVVVNQILAAAT